MVRKIKTALKILGVSFLSVLAIGCTHFKKYPKENYFIMNYGSSNRTGKSSKTFMNTKSLESNLQVSPLLGIILGYQYRNVKGKECEGNLNKYLLGLSFKKSDKTELKFKYSFIDDLDPINEFGNKDIYSNSFSFGLERRLKKPTFLNLEATIGYLNNHEIDHSSFVEMMHYFNDDWVKLRVFYDKESTGNFKEIGFYGSWDHALSKDLYINLGALLGQEKRGQHKEKFKWGASMGLYYKLNKNLLLGAYYQHQEAYTEENKIYLGVCFKF